MKKQAKLPIKEILALLGSAAAGGGLGYGASEHSSHKAGLRRVGDRLPLPGTPGGFQQVTSMPFYNVDLYKPAYDQGFIDKCAEAGADPEVLVKASGGYIPKDILSRAAKAQRTGWDWSGGSTGPTKPFFIKSPADQAIDDRLKRLHKYMGSIPGIKSTVARQNTTQPDRIYSLFRDESTYNPKDLVEWGHRIPGRLTGPDPYLRQPEVAKTLMDRLKGRLGLALGGAAVTGAGGAFAADKLQEDNSPLGKLKSLIGR